MAARFSNIIDVHAHSMSPAWIDLLAGKSAPNPPRFEGCDIPAWNAEAAIDVMDRHEIEAMVLSNPIGTKDLSLEEAVPLARRMNEELADILARYPKRFGAFAALPLQDMDATHAELEYALDTLGFDGVCLQTSFDGAYPGDPRFEPMFAELDRRGSTAFVHPATPLNAEAIRLPIITGILEYPSDTTRAVVSFVLSGMQRRYPNMNYIATHGGGTLPFLAHRIAFVSSQRGTGFDQQMSYDDVIAGFRNIHYDLAIATKRGQLQALLDLVPVDNLMAGFDYPMVAELGIDPMIDSLLSAELFDDGELQAIARNNALKLLPRLARRLQGA
jgi:6-methylsalicylate decarboxylase